MALTSTDLLRYLQDSLNLGPNTEIDTPLFSTGALDSVSMLNLIAFIEETTGSEVRPDQVTLENFDTAGCILRFTGSLAA